jgi:dienelactone hydrolase
MHTSLQIENSSIPIYYVEGAANDPIVLVFSSIYGLTPSLEELCEEISYFGASVVAVNLFWQQGGAAYEEEQTLLALQRKNNIPQMRMISHALAYAQAVREENRSLIALGIGYGGHLAFCCLAEKLVDGAVLWHPSGLGDYSFLLDDVFSLSKPFFIHVGDSDPLFQPHEIQGFREKIQKHNQEHLCQIQMYTNVGVGYSLNNHSSFDENTTQASLQHLEKILHQMR